MMVMRYDAVRQDNRNGEQIYQGYERSELQHRQKYSLQIYEKENILLIYKRSKFHACIVQQIKSL